MWKKTRTGYSFETYKNNMKIKITVRVRSYEWIATYSFSQRNEHIDIPEEGKEAEALSEVLAKGKDILISGVHALDLATEKLLS